MFRKVWNKEFQRKLGICYRDIKLQKKRRKMFAYWIDENSRDMGMNVDSVYCDLEADGLETSAKEYGCKYWIEKMKEDNVIPFTSEYKAKLFLDKLYGFDENESVLGGYQPSGRNKLDTDNPPAGDSGIQEKETPPDEEVSPEEDYKIVGCIETAIPLGLIVAEYRKAIKEYKVFHNEHEGYAVILEEVDELWDEIKKNPQSRDKEKIRKEAIQAGAMILRFLVELT